MNEKKQVFNMYKTQKAKEEKVSIYTHTHAFTNYHVIDHAHHVTGHTHRKSNVSRPRRTERSFVVSWRNTRRSTRR